MQQQDKELTSMNERDYDNYIKERNSYSGTRQDSQQKYDRTITGVSSGALSLSLIAIGIMLSSGNTILCRGAIVVAWCVLGLSIGSVALSHFLSERADGKRITQMDRFRLSGNNYFDKNTENEISRLSHAVWWLNLLSGIFCAVGIILFLIFASYNILRLQLGNVTG